MHFGFWDVALLLAVSILGTAIAYIHSPWWKAFVMALPVPFTLATLSLGRPIDASNVMALNVLLFYTHGVRLLHQRLRLAIVPSIVFSALGYCLIGSALASVLPDDDIAFWMSVAFTVKLGAAFYAFTPHRDEPGHKSPLAVWIKLPLIAGVVLFLIVMKKSLQGFMTVFPMLGVITAYEARHSLWTNCRMIPVVMLCVTPMAIVCRVLQPHIGLGLSLVAAWGVYAIAAFLLMRRLRVNKKKSDGK